MARNPNGTWAVSFSNDPSPAFEDADDPQDFARHNSVYAARTFALTVRVPKLARVKTLRFAVRCSNSGVGDVPAGAAVMHHGLVTVPSIVPLDRISLCSEKTR